MSRSLLCPICHTPIGFSDTICDDCKAQLDSECFDSFMSRCPSCLYPKVADLYVCDRCSQGPVNVIYPVARYDGELSYAVLDSFKFHGHKEMAEVVAMYLNKALQVLDPSRSAILVPIPCSTSRKKRFGWDQMVEVCMALKRQLNCLIINADDNRIQQKRLSRQQRDISSQLRFALNPQFKDALEGLMDKRIIIVDDIITTMNTMNSAMSFLGSCGFEDVCGASWLCEL